MSNSTTLNRRAVTLGASAVASALLVRGSGLAQDATPQATPGGPPQGYPVAIHQGNCEDLSPDPAYEIGDAVTFGTTDGSEPDTIGAEGGVSSVILGVSTDVDNSLDSLGSDGHAIVIHAGPDDPTPVACGNISGAVVDGQLAVAITPVDGSSIVGFALLEDSDGQTNVKVYVVDTSVAEHSEATPAS